MTRLFFTLLFLGVSICFSQSISGSKHLAMANSGVAMVDINTTNIGGIAFCNQSEVSSSTIHRQYLSELNDYIFNGIYLSKLGAFRLQSIYSGYSVYKEGTTKLGYSKKVNETFSLGIEINTGYTSIETYSTKRTLSASIGALLFLSDNLNYGIRISPTNSISNKTVYSKNINALMATGFSYHQNDFIINLDLVKQENLPHPSIKLGVEYAFYNTLFLRIGSSLKPYNVTGGFGVIYEKMKFDFGYSSHEYLQNIYGLGLSYTFDK